VTIAFDEILFAPLYSVFGVDAQMEIGSAIYELRVIDRTVGVAIERVDGGDGVIQSVRPAAAVRAAELANHGIAPETLRGGTLTINGRDWIVHAVQMQPTHRGERDGEVLMFLEAA
jgi:hypothetical protein